jgi:hypothetical protein
MNSVIMRLPISFKSSPSFEPTTTNEWSRLILEEEEERDPDLQLVEDKFLPPDQQLLVEWQRKISIDTRLMLHLLWQPYNLSKEERLTSSIPKGRRAS